MSASAFNLPKLSVIVPCYNESRYIAACLNSILQADYPKEQLEVLIVDGMSSDGTRDIVKQISSDACCLLRLIDNPVRHKPHALNIGIKAATGEVIMRLDAHALYPADYLSLCVRRLMESGADNVGGWRINHPGNGTYLADLFAAVISSRFGGGNAIYRTGATAPREVDTVFGGCYWKTIFSKIGVFDERLLRGQDREFNARLTRSGGRIVFFPDIQCVYYVRSSLLEYFQWTFLGGVVPSFASRLVGYWIGGWRNCVPGLFVLILLALIGYAAVINSDAALWLVMVLGLYGVFSVIAALAVAVSTNKWRIFPALPLVFFLTHFAYGLGFIWGILKPVRATEAWAKV